MVAINSNHPKTAKDATDRLVDEIYRNADKDLVMERLLKIAYVAGMVEKVGLREMEPAMLDLCENAALIGFSLMIESIMERESASN